MGRGGRDGGREGGRERIECSSLTDKSFESRDRCVVCDSGVRVIWNWRLCGIPFHKPSVNSLVPTLALNDFHI